MKIKKVYDISRSINKNITVWPGDENFSLINESSFGNGDESTLNRMNICLHTGTHIDAPLHFVENGKNINNMDISRCIGMAKVFDLTYADVISLEKINDLDIKEGDIILFKTKNSLIGDDEPFKTDYVYIDDKSAKYLAEKKIKTVGIDYLSVENYSDTSHMTHKALLGSDICILENICLKDVPEGEYFLSALPLKIEDAEASPVRAMLLEII